MNTPTFENTVNILVRAYFNGTLQNLNCHACAVGNIIAAANGIAYEENEYGFFVWGGDRQPKWFDGMACGFTEPDNYGYAEAKSEGETSGYPYEELAQIEVVFENPIFYGYRSDDDILDGLMAVVDVLAKIHSVDLSVKENAKLLFVKP